MIEAAMIWNEPNNKSHWDPEIDPGWVKFAEMAVKLDAAQLLLYRAALEGEHGLPSAQSTAMAKLACNQAGWDVALFTNDSPNAFALPGGKVGLYTGIFKVARNQDQLAAVVAHEVGHVVARGTPSCSMSRTRSARHCSTSRPVRRSLWLSTTIVTASCVASAAT